MCVTCEEVFDPSSLCPECGPPLEEILCEECLAHVRHSMSTVPLLRGSALMALHAWRHFGKTLKIMRDEGKVSSLSGG